jgi:outer membrane protein assembly factor BamB
MSLRKGAKAMALALSALAAVVLSGCFGSTKKISPVPTVKQSTTIRSLWSASMPASREFVMSPAVNDTRVCAAAQNGTVACFDAANGRELWRTNVNARISGAVGASPALVVVGSLEGEVIALTAEGKPAWRARVSSEVVGPPAVTDELVVVRSADLRVFAFDVADGKRRWVFQRAAPPLTVRTTAGAAVIQNNVYAGFPGGKMVAIALNNGGLRWESTVSQPKGTTEIERISDVVGAPWHSEREVCAVAYQGRAACFDANTGNTIWAKDVSSASGLGGDGRYVYVSDDKGNVVALERSTGSSIWKQDQLSGRTLSPPLAFGREVVVGDMEGYLHVLSRENGAHTGLLRPDSSGVFAAPVRLPNGFVVQTRSGDLHAYTASP